MFAKVSATIAQSLADSGKVEREDLALCQYGVKQIFTILLNLLTTIVIGCLFGMVLESILFTVSYIPLRSYAGGFHAKTSVRCYVYSIVMIMAVLVILRFFPEQTLYYDVAFLTAGILLLAFAPVEDQNKPLDDLEKKVYRRRTIAIWMIESILIIVLYVLGLKQVWHCLVLSMLALSLLLVAGTIKNIWTRHKK